MRCLSIVIPALNEERNIVPTLENLLPDCRKELDQFELILVDDGSTDRTGEVMERLACENPEIVVIHHSQRRGVGIAYRSGIQRARMEHVTLVPGDNICDPRTWGPLFQAIGTADVVVGYRANQRFARPWYRVVISRIFSNFMCCIHHIRLRDFQGLVIYPTRRVQELGLQATSYMYQMELLVQLHRSGCTIAETPFYMLREDMRSSRSLRLATVVDLLRTLWRLRTLRSGNEPSPEKTP